MSQLLYIVKFCTKNQLFDNKVDEYFYSKKKADDLIDKYRNDDYHWAILHTLQPEE